MKVNKLSLIKPIMEEFFWGKEVLHIYGNTHLTGHMHYMSPIETDSDCGNCDGARCDKCHTYHEVSIITRGECDTHDWINSKLTNQAQSFGVNYNEAKRIVKMIEWSCISDDNPYWEDKENDTRWEIEFFTRNNLEYNYKEYFDLLTKHVYAVYAKGKAIAAYENLEDAERLYTGIRHMLGSKFVGGNGNIEVFDDNKMKYCSYKDKNKEYPPCESSIRLCKEYYGNVGYIPIIK